MATAIGILKQIGFLMTFTAGAAVNARRYVMLDGSGDIVEAGAGEPAWVGIALATYASGATDAVIVPRGVVVNAVPAGNVTVAVLAQVAATGKVQNYAAVNISDVFADTEVEGALDDILSVVGVFLETSTATKGNVRVMQFNAPAR